MILQAFGSLFEKFYLSFQSFSFYRYIAHFISMRAFCIAVQKPSRFSFASALPTLEIVKKYTNRKRMD